MFGPIMTPKPPPGHYYPHESYFWYMIDLAVFFTLCAFTNPGIFFGWFVIVWASGLGPIIMLVWWGWKDWYTRREKKRIDG